MAIGLVGKKCGMTRIFTEDGVSIPVTVVEVTSNRVTQVRTIEVDGYNAVQVTTGTRRAPHQNKSRSSCINKAQAGHFAKAGYETGSELPLGMFEAGQKVDVTGRSIGKGFAGGVKRWGFQMQDATHGNSVSHRAPGSIGQCQTPGRVFKGKKMAGHMGDRQRTAQTLELVRVDEERGLLLIKGSVPGSKGGDVIIRAAIKSPG